MPHSHLRTVAAQTPSRRLYELLLPLDRDQDGVTHQEAFRRCGGRINRADCARRPRGSLSPELSAEHTVRRSLCCATEECRRRAPERRSASADFAGVEFASGTVVIFTI